MNSRKIKTKASPRMLPSQICQERVITEMMPEGWEPTEGDADLSRKFMKSNDSFSLSKALEQIRLGTVNTPSVFYLKSSDISTYIKVNRMGKLEKTTLTSRDQMLWEDFSSKLDEKGYKFSDFDIATDWPEILKDFGFSPLEKGRLMKLIKTKNQSLFTKSETMEQPELDEKEKTESETTTTGTTISTTVEISPTEVEGVEGLTLCNACVDNNIGRVQELLKKNANINQAGEDGITPLYIASSNNFIQLVQELVRINADVNQPEKTGSTPLFIASQNGHSDVVEELIKAKADTDKAKTSGLSPLITASFEGHVSVINLLLSAKADVNNYDNKLGLSALFAACWQNNIDVIKELIRATAHINKVAEDGATPLFIACQNGHTDVLRELLKAKAEIQKAKKDGGTPLTISCFKGHTDIVSQLISVKADVNASLQTGVTALTNASSGGFSEIVIQLIAAKANLDKCLNIGATPLYIACKKGYIDILQPLLQAKANIEKSLNVHRVEVHNINGIGIRKDPVFPGKRIGAKVNCGEVVAYDDTTIYDYKGYFIKFYKLSDGRGWIHNFIPADPRAMMGVRVEGHTPLLIARQRGHENIVQCLLEAKAVVSEIK